MAESRALGSVGLHSVEGTPGKSNVAFYRYLYSADSIGKQTSMALRAILF